MIKLDSIVKGEPKTIRATFLSDDDKLPIDVTGWKLQLALGTSRSNIGDILTVSAIGAGATATNGKISVNLTAEQTEAIDTQSVIEELSVDNGSGNNQPLLIGIAYAQSPTEYRQSFYKTSKDNSQLLKDVPTVVQGDNGAQEITLRFSTRLDPTYDICVIAKFNTLSPDESALLDAMIFNASSVNDQSIALIDTATNLNNAVQLAHTEVMDAQIDVATKTGEVENMHIDVTNMYDALITP